MGKYFGTDGIRGKAGETLTKEMAYKVGRYIGYFCKTNSTGKIVIGKDTRQSSTMFEAALAEAICESGSNVYLLGYVSTPCLAYTAMHNDFSCGVMISASHNPYTDNGIKIFGNNGLKVKDDIETSIEEYIDNPVELEDCGKGRIYDFKSAIAEYQNWLIEKYPLNLKGLKLCVDLCNGSNCYTARQVLDKINANITYINNSPDGTNINNGCGSTHLEMLKEVTVFNDCDLGFAFDGDADRVLFVNKKGETIDGDKIIYLLAKYLKSNNLLTNNKVVTTVMSNIGLYKALDAKNIGYDVTPVGDKNVVESMLNNNYVVGGEQSGHIICTLDSNFGDGLKTALMVLKAITYFDTTIEESVSELTIYPQLLINKKVNDKTIVLNDEEIKAKIAEITNILGKDGRILVRPSGTEPIIRVMVEAKSDEICKQYVDEVIELIEKKGYAQA